MQEASKARRAPQGYPNRRSVLQAALTSAVSSAVPSATALSALSWLGASSPAQAAATFPSTSIRVIVPFGAGGVADLTMRVIAQHMSGSLGQAVVIDNRPGAGGVVAASTVAKAKPDGYTLLLTSNATAISASLFKSLPYDTVKDFQPISTLGSFDLALFVPAGSPIKSYADFVAKAKAKPGTLNVGTINVGSTQNLAAELLKTSAGLDFQVVPFNGSPAVFTALRGGELDAAVEILTPMMQHVKARTVRAILVTNNRRSPALPDAPSAKESGLAQMEVTSWNALAAPAATPRDVIDRLNRAVQVAVADAGVRKQLQDIYIDPKASSPQDAARLLETEISRWRGVIERAGVPRQG